MKVVLIAGLMLGAAAVSIEPFGPCVVMAEPSHEKAVSLGTVKIGKYEVEALQEGKVEAGKEATFELKVKGEPEPGIIRAWVGIESARGSAKSKSHKHGDDIELHVDVPEPIPAESKLWIEIEIDGGKSAGSFAYKG